MSDHFRTRDITSETEDRLCTPREVSDDIIDQAGIPRQHHVQRQAVSGECQLRLYDDTQYGDDRIGRFWYTW